MAPRTKAKKQTDLNTNASAPEKIAAKKVTKSKKKVDEKENDVDAPAVNGNGVEHTEEVPQNVKKGKRVEAAVESVSTVPDTVPAVKGKRGKRAPVEEEPEKPVVDVKKSAPKRGAKVDVANGEANGKPTATRKQLVTKDATAPRDASSSPSGKQKRKYDDKEVDEPTVKQSKRAEKSEAVKEPESKSRGRGAKKAATTKSTEEVENGNGLEGVVEEGETNVPKSKGRTAKKAPEPKKPKEEKSVPTVPASKGARKMIVEENVPDTSAPSTSEPVIATKKRGKASKPETAEPTEVPIDHPVEVIVQPEQSPVKSKAKRGKAPKPETAEPTEVPIDHPVEVILQPEQSPVKSKAKRGKAPKPETAEPTEVPIHHPVEVLVQPEQSAVKSKAKRGKAPKPEAVLPLTEAPIDPLAEKIEDTQQAPAKIKAKRGKTPAAPVASVAPASMEVAVADLGVPSIALDSGNTKKRLAKPLHSMAEVVEEKPSRKGGRAKKDVGKQEDYHEPTAKKASRKRVIPTEDDIDNDDEDDIDLKPSKAKKEAKPKAKPAADKPKMNATNTDFSKIDFTFNQEHNLKIASWNVAGLRSLATKGGFEYFEHEKPDIICLQEIKCLEEDVPELAKPKGYHPYWNSKKGGHAGVAIYSKIMPYHVDNGFEDSDDAENDGRIITAEFEKFFVVCVYVQNAGRKLVTLPDRLKFNKQFEQHLTKLNEKKPVIVCGDMNVAHSEIDLTNPKTNTKNAGFTKDERDGMTDLLSLGFIDTFRYLYPNKDKAYTFWSFMGGNRAKNVGWRLDYFITSERLQSKVVENIMRSEVLGSDHCPIVLLLNL